MLRRRRPAEDRDRPARQKLTGKNVLLLNAGDNFQGSLFYTTYKGAAEAEVLNLMKFDAMTVGNHEFDDSDDGLATFLDKITFPVVTANVLPRPQSKIGDRIKPSLVLDVGGQKIGIVGAVTNDTPELSSPGPTADRGRCRHITAAVEELKKQGVDKIIALTHVGYPRDLAVIAKIPMSTWSSAAIRTACCRTPTRRPKAPIRRWSTIPAATRFRSFRPAPIQKYLGDLVVIFDDNGVVKSAKGDPILIDAKSIKPDEAVLARIKELASRSRS